MLVNPNRTVAALTPLVFAPAAGAISALAGKYGLDLDGGELSAIFVAGATIAFAKAGLWMKGWQDYEKREQIARDAPVFDAAFAADDSDVATSSFADDLDVDDDFEFDIDDEDAMDAFEAQFAGKDA